MGTARGVARSDVSRCYTLQEYNTLAMHLSQNDRGPIGLQEKVGTPIHASTRLRLLWQGRCDAPPSQRHSPRRVIFHFRPTAMRVSAVHCPLYGVLCHVNLSHCDFNEITPAGRRAESALIAARATVPLMPCGRPLSLCHASSLRRGSPRSVSAEHCSGCGASHASSAHFIM